VKRLRVYAFHHEGDGWDYYVAASSWRQAFAYGGEYFWRKTAPDYAHSDRLETGGWLNGIPFARAMSRPGIAFRQRVGDGGRVYELRNGEWVESDRRFQDRRKSDRRKS